MSCRLGSIIDHMKQEHPTSSDPPPHTGDLIHNTVIACTTSLYIQLLLQPTLERTLARKGSNARHGKTGRRAETEDCVLEPQQITSRKSIDRDKDDEGDLQPVYASKYVSVKRDLKLRQPYYSFSFHRSPGNNEIVLNLVSNTCAE